MQDAVRSHINDMISCMQLSSLRNRGAGQEQVTVVVNTFHRHDLLRGFVSHFSECTAVDRIHINWAESLEPIDLSAEADGQAEVTFAMPLATHNDSSLNTRFLPVAGAHRCISKGACVLHTGRRVMSRATSL